MLKRALMVAVVATAISVPAIAGGATKRKPKVHSFQETALVYNFSPAGAIVQGKQVFAGIIDGTLGGKPIHAAFRGVNNVTGASFNGTLIEYTPQGTINETITGTGAAGPNNTLTVSGSGKDVSGTGAYKGIKGSFTLTGQSGGGDADNDGDASVLVLTSTGSAKY